MPYNDPPWHPITTPIDLKLLGKLGEELGECQAAVSRCIIQGLEGRNPDNSKVNRHWLEEEIADVVANIDLVIRHFKLSAGDIDTRATEKIRKLRIWHKGV